MKFLTANELKVLARSRQLQVGGVKSELVARLVQRVPAHDDEIQFMTFLTVDELRVLCRARGLKVGGTKGVLIIRLVSFAKRESV